MPPSPVVRWQHALQLLLISALWGSSYPVTKIALQGFAPFSLAAVRFAAAALVLFAVLRVRRRPVALPIAQAPRVAVLGLFQSALFTAGLNFAVAWIPAGQASVLVYSYPLIVTLAARIFLREPLGTVRLAGLAVGLAGVALAGWEHVTGSMDPRGVAAALGAALSWTAASIVFKRGLATVDPLSVAAWQSLFAALWLCVPVAVLERAAAVAISGPVLAATLWLSVCGVAVAYVLWFRVLAQVETTAASSYTFAAPVFGVLLSLALLGEPLTLRLLTAVALVAAGIYLVNRPPAQIRPTQVHTV